MNIYLLALIGTLIAHLFVLVRPASGLVTPGRIAPYASRGTLAAGIFGLVMAGVVGIVVSGLIIVFTTCFASNEKALAALPNIKVESPSLLPPTDLRHIVPLSPTLIGPSR